MKTYCKFFLLALALSSIQKTISQVSENALTSKEKKAIVASIQTHLNTSYIHLDLSNKMVAALHDHLNSKKYRAIEDPSEFSQILTQDLQYISKDLHLRVQFEPKRIAQIKEGVPKERQEKMQKMMAMQMAQINYGFTETKVLTGNIGYLNLRMFADTTYAKETATSAMHFLSNTNAIIIDLRSNKGGVPSMIQLLSSYFLDEEPVLLSNFYERQTNSKTQLHSLAKIDGKRITDKPVYILTSKNTFSAAEAFAYNLKHFNKAIIVGEVTKGGANRAKRFIINDQFTISIPYIESIHPITKSNWEGKGVQPDLDTNENEAFVKAYIDAINKTVIKNKNGILNKIGYTFLQEKSVDEAIVVFQENAKLFPKDTNAWDSLGEAYFIKDDKENTLKCYRKVLELEPSSESAKQMIKKLERNR